MTAKLDNQKVAVLVADGFEQSEMTQPRLALDMAGASTVLISLKSGEVRAWSGANWGDSFPVDRLLADVNADEFDALLLPGGVLNPDKLRMTDAAVAFVKAFGDAGIASANSYFYKLKGDMSGAKVQDDYRTLVPIAQAAPSLCP